MGARTMLMILPSFWEVAQFDANPKGRSLKELAELMRHELLNPANDDEDRVPMDIDLMVQKWVELVVGLCTSHTKEDRDEADFSSDEVLLPIIGAPVDQIREFAIRLGGALENDPRVPYMLWRGYRDITLEAVNRWHDEEIIELKIDLAEKIANLVTPMLAPTDISDAIVGALQWRNPKELEKVAAAVEGGAKPRIVGRQSCLFLEVDTEDNQLVRVML